jgi:hypothetical protein
MLAFVAVVDPASPALSSLIRDAALVVPVVPTLNRFTEFVPADLRLINGMALWPEDPDLEHVASVLLEGPFAQEPAFVHKLSKLAIMQWLHPDQ